MTQDTDLVARLRAAHAGEGTEYDRFDLIDEAADRIEALSRENGSLQAEKATDSVFEKHWRERATSAESELTTLRAELLEARKRLGEIETAALLYVGGEADTSLDAASALIGRIATIAKETSQ